MSPRSPSKSSDAKKDATMRHKSDYVLHKNSNYARKVESKRKRWKPLKQIIDGIVSGSSKRNTTTGGEEGMVKQSSRKRRKDEKTSLLSSQVLDLTSIAATEENYVTIAVAPSIHPPLQHYCDVTGLPTQYRDPKTGLYYKDASVFAAIRACSTQRVQQFLGLRNAGVNI